MNFGHLRDVENINGRFYIKSAYLHPFIVQAICDFSRLPPQPMKMWLMYFITGIQVKHSYDVYDKTVMISIHSILFFEMATEIWVNVGSGNGLVPDGTKPLPERMLTYHKYRLMTFKWGGQFHKRYLSHWPLK